MKKIVIAGGTGFIGSYIANRFSESGYRVLIISRDPAYISWKSDDMIAALNCSEMVINLAGKSINCKHNESNKKVIIESRISATLQIGNAILACKTPPKLWINASATGIYKPSVEYAMTEDDADFGTNFLSEVVRRWENTFFEFQLPETRQVALRTSVVLGRKGGTLKPLVWLSRIGLGGRQGIGNQIFSWIHVEDYFRILQFLIEMPKMIGVVNCGSPKPVSNLKLMSVLRGMLRVPFGIPAPEFAIKIAAKLIGTESELILNSSYIFPKRLLDRGFEFNFPTIELALTDLLHFQ